MKRSLWALALLIDVVGLAAAWPLFTSEPDATSVIWGVVLVGVLGGLLLLLIRPRLFGSYAATCAKVLCAAVPGVAFLGSLDSASISGHEVIAIAVAALAGWLNWVAFKGHPTHAAPRAA